MKKKELRNRLFMGVYAVLLLGACAAVCDCTREKGGKRGNKLTSMPVPVYTAIPDSLPFLFEVSDQVHFTVRKEKDSTYFCDIDYPALQARIYCTWHGITPDRFPLMAQESHKLAYQHSLVATNISERIYSNDSSKVYGLLYMIEGDAATPLQVALTDSVSFFFNASLYFNSAPNADSIAPVLEYVRKDVERMMETFTPNHK